MLVHPIPRQEIVLWGSVQIGTLCRCVFLQTRTLIPTSLAGSDAARGGCSEERLPLAAD